MPDAPSVRQLLNCPHASLPSPPGTSTPPERSPKTLAGRTPRRHGDWERPVSGWEEHHSRHHLAHSCWQGTKGGHSMARKSPCRKFHRRSSSSSPVQAMCWNVMCNVFVCRIQVKSGLQDAHAHTRPQECRLVHTNTDRCTPQLLNTTAITSTGECFRRSDCSTSYPG